MQSDHAVRTRSAAIIVLPILLSLPGIAAAIECYQCHGSNNPPDYRPMDAPYRNITTGGFSGNHRSHMEQAATPASCESCHPGSSDYSSSHRNSLIEIAPNINNSPLTARYRNGSTVFPQRTDPRLGSCSNVNCHFERETPTWGGPRFTVPASCGKCHGSPPEGGDTGAAGSHAQHDLYYTGLDGCAKCHTDHRADSSSFGHATSAGRTLVLAIQNPFSSPRGSYSGAVDDYLPSQTNQFGSCSELYCHSSGNSRTSFVPNVVPAWGTPLPSDCTGCHGNGHGTAGEIASGSHTMHVGRYFYGQYVFACSACHNSTASGNSEISNRANHVNRKIDIVLSPSIGGSYTANGHAPGGAVGQCTNVYCHSNVQPDGGVGGPTAYANPVWGAADSIGCGGCHATGGHGHGTTSRMATGSHVRHLSYSFTTTTDTVKCMICHKYTDYPFITSCFGNPYGNIICHASGTSVKHANGKVDVRLDPIFGNMSAYQGSPEPGNGYSNCSNSYCHSDGTSIATGSLPPSSTPNWGSGTLACTACHGNPPAYGNGTPKANSHIQISGVSCDHCHFGTTASGSAVSSTVLHVNRAYDVTAGNGAAFAYSYAASGGTCSGISCHGGKNATWGTALPCNECHDAPPDTVSHGKHFSGSTAQAAYGDVRIAQDFTPDASGYLMNCGNCHPMDRSKHGNGVVDIELYNAQAPAGSLKAMNPASASYANGTTSHIDSRGFIYTNGTCSNVYCHSYNDWTTTAAIPPDDPDWQTKVAITRQYRAMTWGGPSLTCSGCHGNPTQTAYPANNSGAGDSHAWIDSYGYGNLHTFNLGFAPVSCSYCHNETVKQTNSYSRNSMDVTILGDVPISNFSKHVNGRNNVAFDTQNSFVYAGSGGDVPMSLAGATYAPETKTCANVSCHMQETTVKWGTPYRVFYDSCDRCHGYSGP